MGGIIGLFILFLQSLSQIIYFTSEAISESYLFCKINQSLGFVEKDASLAVSLSLELVSFHHCLCFSYNLIINIFKYRGKQWLLCPFLFYYLQVLLELHELFPAIQAAEKAVSLNPHWHVAHQTLGRAQMGYGDVEMASIRKKKKKQDHSRHLEGHIINLVIIAFFDVRV